MFGALVIVFREVIEAGIIVGIILAVTKGVPHRGRWVAGGIAVGVAGAATPFPAPVTGIVCDYHGAADNVIIEVLMNISPSFISNFTAVETYPSGPGGSSSRANPSAS